jgi:hypothetical protein
MESSLTLILNLMAAQFKEEMAAAMAMTDKLPVEKTFTYRMVTSGGTGTSTMAETVEKDASKVDAAVTGMASTVGTSVGRVETETEQHIGRASQAISSFSGMPGRAASSMESFHSRTLSAINQTAGPLMSILPTAAAVGFGAMLLSAAQTAHQIEIFSQQSGQSINISKQWVGAAEAFQIPPRALSMTLKNLGQMLTNVQNAQEAGGKTMQTDAKLTEAVNTATFNLQVAKEKAAIAQTHLNDAAAKDPHNSVAYAQAYLAYQQAEDGVTKATDALTTAHQNLSNAQNAVGGLTSKQSAALSDLGIKLLDNNGKTISSTQLMIDLANAYQNATNKQRASAEITQILGGRAYALLPLIEQGGDALKDALQNGGEALSQYNDKNTKSLNTAYISIHDIEDAMKNALANVVADMTPAITFIQGHLNVFKDLAEAIAGLYTIKKIGQFGGGVISDIGNLAKIVAHPDQIINGLKNIFGFGGGAQVPSRIGKGGIDLSRLGQSVVVQAFGPEAIAVLEGRGDGGKGPHLPFVPPGAGAGVLGDLTAGGASVAAPTVAVGAAVVGSAVIAGNAVVSVLQGHQHALQEATNKINLNMNDVALKTTDYNAVWGVLQGHWKSSGSMQETKLNELVQTLTLTSDDVGQTREEAGLIYQAWQQHLITSKPDLEAAASYIRTYMATSGGLPPTMTDIANYLVVNRNAAQLAASHGQTFSDLVQSLANATGQSANAIISAYTETRQFADDMAANQAEATNAVVTPQGKPGHIRDVAHRYATGGWITEPVFGYGLVSKESYSIAENGPEFVGSVGQIANARSTGSYVDAVPMTATSGTSPTIINIEVSGNTLLSQTHIEELVRKIEARLVTAMLPMAGRHLTM